VWFGRLGGSAERSISSRWEEEGGRGMRSSRMLPQRGGRGIKKEGGNEKSGRSKERKRRVTEVSLEGTELILGE